MKKINTLLVTLETNALKTDFVHCKNASLSGIRIIIRVKTKSALVKSKFGMSVSDCTCTQTL